MVSVYDVQMDTDFVTDFLRRWSKKHQAIRGSLYSEENVDDSTSLNCYVVLDIVDDIHRESSTMELSNFYFYVVVRTKSEFPAQSPFISSVHFWLTGSKIEIWRKIKSIFMSAQELERGL